MKKLICIISVFFALGCASTLTVKAQIDEDSFVTIEQKRDFARIWVEDQWTVSTTVKDSKGVVKQNKASLNPNASKSAGLFKSAIAAIVGYFAGVQK